VKRRLGRRLLKRLVLTGVALGFIAAALAWVASAPRLVSAHDVSGLTGNRIAGARLFNIGGCASCHAKPGATGAGRRVLSGGRVLKTPFGSFYPPNISPDPDFGIGTWTLVDFASAIRFGTAPGGRHFYPAFLYTSYTRLSLQSIADLKAFLDTLPRSTTVRHAQDVRFPFNIRRAIGLWKTLFFRRNWVVKSPNLSGAAIRGRALVEGPGHCGECHTPRGLFGQLIYKRWMAGARNPTGKGRIPSLLRDKFDWSAVDIADYLKSGFTPEFDSAGGEMVDVIENTSRLSDRDRADIAAYLKSL